MNKFETVDVAELSTVIGGKGKKKRNNTSANVFGLGIAATGGAALGSAICGPACGYVGAHYGAIGWTAVTGFTGGFGKIRK